MVRSAYYNSLYYYRVSVISSRLVRSYLLLKNLTGIQNMWNSLFSVFLGIFIGFAFLPSLNARYPKQTKLVMWVALLVTLCFMTFKQTGNWRYHHIPWLTTDSERANARFIEDVDELIKNVKQVYKN